MLKEVGKSRRRVCVGQLELVFRSIITHDCRVLKVEEGNSEFWNLLITVNNRYHVRLNTRCHLLAFAAKVEKQLQATVSIQ